ncbi:MAG: hypothetical protein Q8P31_00440 [Bacillota bacterium]|nr:hypothetical protein [Bacillota bacterium]
MAALLLLLALAAVILLWALAERQFKRRFLAAMGPVRPGDVAEQMPWDRKMAIIRRHELLNWAVAFSLLAILGGFVTVCHGYYVTLMENTDPPQFVAARGSVAGPAPATVLRWSAWFPGGRMWPVVEDGGFVLVRAVRGRYDQYFLFSPTGEVIWSGERVPYGPAPRTAIAPGAEEGEGCVQIAVEDAAGGATLLVLEAGGAVRREERLDTYPDHDSDSVFFSPKSRDGVMRTRPASPDGRWLVDSRLLPSLSLIISRLNFYGPGPGAPGAP